MGGLGVRVVCVYQYQNAGLRIHNVINRALINATEFYLCYRVCGVGARNEQKGAGADGFELRCLLGRNCVRNYGCLGKYKW